MVIRKKFLNTNLFHIKTFLITEFDCISKPLLLFLGEDGEEKKEGEDESPKEKEAGETADETPEVKKAEGPSKATVFLDSLRSVASQVPSLFKGQKDKKAKSEEKDVEAGEKEELLETGEEVKTEPSIFQLSLTETEIDFA